MVFSGRALWGPSGVGPRSRAFAAWASFRCALVLCPLLQVVPGVSGVVGVPALVPCALFFALASAASIEVAFVSPVVRRFGCLVIARFGKLGREEKESG